MRFRAYFNKSEKNRIDKELEEIVIVTGTLRSESSIIDPIIQARMYSATPDQRVQSINYIYLEEFKRYYFVNNIVSIRNDLWELQCHVDVLGTYADEIKNQKAIVKRQQDKWSLYLNDGSFKVYQNPIVLTKPFPNGFTANEFVLAIAGS